MTKAFSGYENLNITIKGQATSDEDNPINLANKRAKAVVTFLNKSVPSNRYKVEEVEVIDVETKHDISRYRVVSFRAKNKN